MKILNTIKNFLFIVTIALITGLTSLSCEGPEGPTGAQGPQGSEGPQGLQGPQGEEGTANVIYSPWMDIEWDEDESNSKIMFIAELLITEEFVETGTVLMFIKSSGGNLVYPLPFVNGSDFLYYALGYEPGIIVGLVFSVESMNGSTVNSYPDNQIRYVLIPDGIENTAGKQIDFNNYDQVAKWYGITD